MLSFDEARARLLSQVSPLPSERVPLSEAHGRVLARSLYTQADLPPFDASTMDGYAVRSADFERGSGPWRLPVEGQSRAGSTALLLLPGSACRIFTGALLPTGADAVVMQEEVERLGDAALFTQKPRAGQYVRRRGEDLPEGTLALAAGTRLRASHLALCAMLDHAELVVAQRPRVTLVATGDELRAPGSPLRPGAVPESNTYALAAMARRAGAQVAVLASLPDDLETMTSRLDQALSQTDVLVTVGGVSVGAHDWVRPALERLGVALDFWKVAIKPGKPLALGRRGQALTLSLPGNPASALVTFALFGLPLLRGLQGDLSPLPLPLFATLASPVSHGEGRLEFMRATLERSAEGLKVSALSHQASGALTPLVAAQALLCVPADRATLAAGEQVQVLMLEELGL